MHQVEEPASASDRNHNTINLANPLAASPIWVDLALSIEIVDQVKRATATAVLLFEEGVQRTPTLLTSLPHAGTQLKLGS
jgi:hypothetical protein